MGIMRRGRGLVGYVALGSITLLFLGLAIVLLRVPAQAAVLRTWVLLSRRKAAYKAVTTDELPRLSESAQAAISRTSSSSSETSAWASARAATSILA